MIGFRSVGSDYGLGGIERVVEEVGSRMASEGHEVTLFTRTRYCDEGLSELKGMRIHPVSALYTKSLESPSNALFATARALRGFDIIHYHATMPALFSGLPRLFGRKTVVTVHGLDWKRAKWGPLTTRAQKVGAWAAARFPDATVVCSRTLVKHYKEVYGVEPRYIPNAVEPMEPRPLDIARRHEIEQGGYLLSLGRIVPEKGVHTLIQAFRQVETDKKLLIVGKAPYMRDYREKLRRLAAGDERIVFTGPIYGREKEEIYTNAYLFCLPSTIEGMALVLLEAMNFEKLCLVSDIPENVEVIDPGFYGEHHQDDEICGEDVDAPEPEGGRPFGWTFRQGAPIDLARKLRALLDRPALVERIGQRSRSFVHESFSWERSTEQHIDLYRSLLGR